MGLGLEQDGWQAVPQLCHTSFSGHIPFPSVAVFICENVTLKYLAIKSYFKFLKSLILKSAWFQKIVLALHT